MVDAALSSSLASCISFGNRELRAKKELIHDYLPESLKQIVVWVGRLASIE